MSTKKTKQDKNELLKDRQKCLQDTTIYSTKLSFVRINWVYCTNYTNNTIDFKYLKNHSELKSQNKVDAMYTSKSFSFTIF